MAPFRFDPVGTPAHIGIDQHGRVHLFGRPSGSTWCEQEEPILQGPPPEDGPWELCEPCGSIGLAMGMLTPQGDAPEQEEASDGDSPTE